MTSNVPTIIVHNYLETFRDFLSRTGSEEALFARRFNGDQALYWLGNSKLIFSSAPISDAETICERWEYHDVETAYPKNPSPQLSQDILDEQDLLDLLLAAAGPNQEIDLIPYATTPEFLLLAETLQKKFGLIVNLPESPTPENLWVNTYIDTKVGFRTLLSQWVPEKKLCPFGFISEDIDHACKIVEWFRSEEKGCVIKASQGGSGVGNLFLSADQLRETKNIKEKLRENIFLKEDTFIIEEYILSPSSMSPSLEFFVPSPENGKPKITYLSNQHFGKSGRFAGVIIGKELLDAAWYPKFRKNGLKIAQELQTLGYVGHFDLDAIVDENDEIYLLEINARRTGGTYAHEFLQFIHGEDYLDQITALSQNKISSHNIFDLNELESTIGDLMYPINDDPRGIIIALTSTLPEGDFGFIAIGRSIKDSETLKTQMVQRLEQAH